VILAFRPSQGSLSELVGRIPSVQPLFGSLGFDPLPWLKVCSRGVQHPSIGCWPVIAGSPSLVPCSSTDSSRSGSR
jgi:hypothetical protein